MLRRHGRNRNNAFSVIILLFLFSFIFFIGSFNSCKKPTPPEEYRQSIFLSAEDAGVTEVWLKITFTDVSEQRGFTLKREGQAILTTHNSPRDTLIVDEGLLPKHTYTYKAYRLVNSTPVDSSAPLLITTMDTTSHEFTWQIDMLGDGASSVLYDVAIVNDTLVYAVGEIYKKDSMGNFENEPYGLAIWNGREWRLRRIYAPPFLGYQSVLTPKGIFAFSPTDVWFASGGVHHFNGVTVDRSYWINAFPGNPNPIWTAGQYAQKLWGKSSSDLYVIGTNGAIAYFNGSSASGGWRRLESGTTLPIYDIWGAMNQRTGNLEILCIASNQFIDQGRRLLRLSGSTVVALPDSGLSWALNTIWFVPERKYIIGGDGLYISRTLPQTWARDLTMPPYYKTSVRGTSINDIVVVGAFGLFLHYNGVTWRNYHEQTYMPTGAFGRVDIKGNILVAAGGVDNKAVVLIGRR